MPDVTSTSPPKPGPRPTPQQSLRKDLMAPDGGWSTDAVSSSGTESNVSVTNRMASFAMLTADWEDSQSSYLDNFIDFALGAISTAGLTEFTSTEVQKAMATTYAVMLPEKVVSQIIRRAGKRNYVDSVGSGRYRVTKTADERTVALPSKNLQFERELRNLEEDFVVWAKSNADLDLSVESANRAILEYIETYYGSLMSSAAGSGSIGQLPPVNPTDEIRTVAAYLKNLNENDPNRFGYVVNIAKGSMLVAGLFVPDAIHLNKSFKDTVLVFDTKIIIQLLGYEGLDVFDSVNEYVSLARSQGAGLAIFERTLVEIELILRSAENSARIGRLWDWKPGSVGSFFLNNNRSSGDIALEVSMIRERILGLGVAIIAEPPYNDRRHVVDEKEVEQSIRNLSLYQKEAALIHDVRALAAIVRMRGGRAKDNLEECRAVFVTTNSNVVRASRRVRDMRDEPYFVSVFDTDIATLTWIKTPPSAPDLPRKTLLATCWSVLQPSDAMWGKYVREMEHQHSTGSLTDAELIVLRQRFERDRVAISIHTLESDESVAAAVTLSAAEARTEMERSVSSTVSAREERLQNTLGEKDKLLAERELSESNSVRNAAKANSNLERIDAKIVKVSRFVGQVSRWLIVVGIIVLLLVGVSLIPEDPFWANLGKVIVSLLAVTGGALKPGALAGAWCDRKVLAVLRRNFPTS